MVESADEDIFSDDYLISEYERGQYRVLRQVDHGNYKTSRKVRTIELRDYASPDGEDEDLSRLDDSIREKLEQFDESRDESPLPPDAEYSIVRSPDGKSLQIVDDGGEVVYEDFTLDELKCAKESFSGSDVVERDDLKNQDFIKFVLVFLGGLAVGAIATYTVMKQKHTQELSALHGKIDQLTQQMQAMSAPRQRMSPEQMLVAEYNRATGRPEG